MRLKENEIIEQFERQIDKYAPLKIKSIEREVPLSQGMKVDAIIEFCVGEGPCFKALVEIKSIASPKEIISTVVQLAFTEKKSNEKEMVPLLIVPYMGAEQIQILQRDGISWIDLCGNMVIRAPGGIYIERTGRKNLFPDTSPIKKIFEGTSSLVSRALLLKKEPFKSLNKIYRFINERDGNITLSTVSKVLGSLEEELLVRKDENGISVIDREKLLNKLLEGYVDYTKRNKNKTYTFAVQKNQIGDFAFNDFKCVACGFYAAKLKGLATTDRITFYVESVKEAQKEIERSKIILNPDTEFGQLDLIETRNLCVWFNVQGEPLDKIVDDLELYLEMMIDTPRGPKVAEILEERILKGQV
ncbi:MAG: hypothetical protein JW749_07565 [Sedimentisphaerales bacterium]|nr:hypothetical protein [Sedimentisphaerales bacterium]